MAEKLAPGVRFTRKLSNRQHQVARLMAAGLAKEEIAAQLGISVHTVKTYARFILGILSAPKRAAIKERLGLYDKWVGIGCPGLPNKSGVPLTAMADSKLEPQGADTNEVVFTERLSSREEAVAMLMRPPVTNKQLAARLFVSTGTIKTHVRSILRKLQAASRNDVPARLWQYKQWTATMSQAEVQSANELRVAAG